MENHFKFRHEENLTACRKLYPHFEWTRDKIFEPSSSKYKGVYKNHVIEIYLGKIVAEVVNKDTNTGVSTKIAVANPGSIDNVLRMFLISRVYSD